MIGEQFGSWVVLGFSKTRDFYLVCECACGHKKEVRQDHLLSGRSTKCKSCSGKINGTKHRMSNNSEYHIWATMKDRCSNPNNLNFYNYGGRGIKVCDWWSNSFENFYADMGPRPSKDHTIDRIDNNGNYEPGNCRWETAREQSRNTRTNNLITYKNQTKCVADWCEEFGLKYSTVSMRINKYGWDPISAITTPSRGYTK